MIKINLYKILVLLKIMSISTLMALDGARPSVSIAADVDVQKRAVVKNHTMVGYDEFMQAYGDARKNPDERWIPFWKDLNTVYLPRILAAKDSEALRVWREAQIAHEEKFKKEKYNLFLCDQNMLPVTLEQLVQTAQKTTPESLSRAFAAVLTKRFEKDPALKGRLLWDVCQPQPADTNIKYPHTKLYRILISGDPSQPILHEGSITPKTEYQNPMWGIKKWEGRGTKGSYENRSYTMVEATNILCELYEIFRENYYNGLREKFKESFETTAASVFSTVASKNNITEAAVKTAWEACEQKVLTYYQTVKAEEIQKRISPDGVISKEEEEAAQSEARKRTYAQFDLHIKYESVWNGKRIIRWGVDAYPVPLDGLILDSMLRAPSSAAPAPTE